MPSRIQILFNRAVTHIRNQGVPGSLHDSCRLLTEDGNRCAVGGLITSQFYRKKLEYKPVPTDPDALDLRIAIYRSNPDLNLNVHHFRTTTYWQMLNDLQVGHDMVAQEPNFLEKFEERVENIRVKYGLEEV